MGIKLPQIENPWICGCLLALGGVDMGFGLVYSSFTLTAITNEFNLTDTESIWFNVGGILAAMVGALVINPLVGKFGKKYCLFGSAIYGTICWVLLGVSSNKIMAFVFRILSGTTIGLYSTICPTFISEVAPIDHKYLFGFMNQIGIAIGFLVVTVLGIAVSWHTTSIICGVPSMIFILTALLIPEQQTTLVVASTGHLIKYKKELFIAFLCMFFLQFSGINAVMSNMQIILESANLSISSSLIGILTNVVQLLATVISAGLVDKLGNRVCWIISAAGQLVAFVLMCLHQKLELPSWLFMIALFLEQLTYGVGTGPIPFAAAAELFRVELRAPAMAVSTAENWLLSAIVCLIWPYLEDALTLGYAFLFFAGIQVLSIIFGLIVFIPVSKDAEKDENSYSDDETEQMSRRLSHTRDIPEL